MKTLGLSILFLSTIALGSASWMKQVSGIGRAGTRAEAEKYARMNLQGEIESHEALCAEHGGDVTTESWEYPLCQKYPVSWQCTIGAKITCRF